MLDGDKGVKVQQKLCSVERRKKPLQIFQLKTLTNLTISHTIGRGCLEVIFPSFLNPLTNLNNCTAVEWARTNETCF